MKVTLNVSEFVGALEGEALSFKFCEIIKSFIVNLCLRTHGGL